MCGVELIIYGEGALNSWAENLKFSDPFVFCFPK